MDQHLVSQFVIKNWAADDGQVEVFDLRRWDTRRELPGEFVEQHARPTPPPVSEYPMIEADPYEMWRR